MLSALARIGLAAALIAVNLVGGSLKATAADRPNIVFILTDDEDLKAHAYLSKTKSLIEDQGTVLDNYFVSYSFCCPSRATTLRGQYPHNHRIVGNDLPTGGAVKFRTMGLDQSTVGTWLKDAGYRTALIGKYLNQYDPEADGVPPGWTEWYVPGSHDYAYFDYWLNENGRPVRYGKQAQDYMDDVLARHATGFIRRSANTDQPFFLYLAPYAPHSPATGAPRHAGMFAKEPFRHGPAYDEADVSDKPSVVRNLPRLLAWQIEANERHYRERLRALQAVDDMVEGVVRTLEETGELDNTYIVYTSDNGFHLGEHRMFIGKTTAYEEDIHVPFAIRGPGVPKGGRVGAFVLNNDLAPTFAALAGVKTPGFVDGRSFLPLLADPQTPWRTSFAVERRQRETHEIDGAAAFDGLRTRGWTYLEYGSGERELYDLANDPHQLSNAVDTADPAMIEAFSQRLAELVNCAGLDCRRIEDLPLRTKPALVASPSQPVPTTPDDVLRATLAPKKAVAGTGTRPAITPANASVKPAAPILTR
jgi:N-acetylglucosamine-6-sulfatase